MKKKFVVIGLGSFGSSVCKELYALGHEILAVDMTEERVKAIANFATYTAVANGTTERDLHFLGANKFSNVIVGFEDDLQASVLCTLALKEIGVETVWVVAHNHHQQVLLEKVGADRVIEPEKEMGIRVAHLLDSNTVMNSIDFPKD